MPGDRPRVGSRHELKRATEDYWVGRVDAVGLQETAAGLRQGVWRESSGVDREDSHHMVKGGPLCGPPRVGRSLAARQRHHVNSLRQEKSITGHGRPRGKHISDRVLRAGSARRTGSVFHPEWRSSSTRNHSYKTL
ncbi:hypothetical protein [Streptosporangium sp. LJ11]|uniref:hypothetical protein n=1 Tax=Streptosporangium sp. LJ11 TaxID=3436927 RepID=UPI003F790D26